MIKTAVVGAAGFAGVELVRLLVRHPAFELCCATSTELAGSRIDDAYPALKGATDLAFERPDADRLAKCALVFLAVPHTAALDLAPDLVKAGKTVIDLSADFRLKNPEAYRRWYNVEHTAPDVLATAAFGLPELFPEDLARARVRRSEGAGALVACAGCYPTATSLAAAPALQEQLVGEGLVVADAVSGVSGAGKRASARTHFCFANENVEAYGVGGHRHTPEIEQILGIEGRLSFTPHLAPYDRGLLSTVTLPLASQASLDQARLTEVYRRFYEGCSFVSVLDSGAQPRTASVVGSNRAHVAAALDERVGAIVATCAIDNIGKGAAGQAVQCANVVCGIEEDAGLRDVAMPV